MALVLEGVGHCFGRDRVIDGASLEAAPGEIVCLFGPSGCGKKTLLRLAAGLERLQEGAVKLDGAALATPEASIPAEKRPIGFVFQDFVLFPHLTVEKNIAFGLAGLPADARAARIAEELAAVDLTPYKDRFPHELSGGQQQRAALARAFARRPRAMLLDEPFASIDVALRQRLRGDMRRLLKARGTPTIFVTHDPAEAIEIGDKIAVMRAGRIIETAAPATLFAAPKTAEGASIFPGSQILACRPVEGGVETAFGPIAIAQADGATHVVIHEGGALATEGDDIPVIDCRFAPPRWMTTLADARGSLRAVSREAMAAGARARLSFDAVLVRPLRL